MMGGRDGSEPLLANIDPASGSYPQVEALRCPPKDRLASISDRIGRLVIPLDSLSFVDLRTPQPPNKPGLYPRDLGRRQDVATSRPLLGVAGVQSDAGLQQKWPI